MGQEVQGIKDARERINGEAREEIIQRNYMLCLFYQNKHTNTHHPKNTLHLILYGLALLVSYRNSLCCIIITTSLLLLFYFSRNSTFILSDPGESMLRHTLFWQCLALSVIFFCSADINASM